jgi:TPR repeat protein
MIHLRRGVRGLPSKTGRTRAAFLGIVTGLAMNAATAVANDVQSARACDLAAASPTDPMRPAGITGISIDDIETKTALPACQAALAADPDNPRLLFEMARVFLASNNGLKAFTLIRDAADRGYADAQYMLGLIYMKGEGVPKDDRAAARWFKSAADQDYARAEAFIGAYLLVGRGIEKDEVEAARYLKLAVAHGDADAQAFLGTMYASGSGGLPHDEREAARLFMLAAKQGNDDAQYNLGVLYKDGRGVDQDEGLAVFWFTKAAEQGNVQAKTFLAQLEKQARQPPKTPKVPSAVSYACFLDSFNKSGAVYHGKDSDKESADKFDRLNKECINNYLTTGRMPQ